jgi:hypothetical protein
MIVSYNILQTCAEPIVEGAYVICAVCMGCGDDAQGAVVLRRCRVLLL